MVGMGEKSDPPPIAYRERSPLVVPPKLDLPTPQQPASQRAKNPITSSESTPSSLLKSAALLTSPRCQ